MWYLSVSLSGGTAHRWLFFLLRGMILSKLVDTFFSKISRLMRPVPKPHNTEIRYLDKLVDALAKGKAMDKILRK